MLRSRNRIFFYNPYDSSSVFVSNIQSAVRMKHHITKHVDGPGIIFRHIQPLFPNGLYEANSNKRFPEYISSLTNEHLALMIFKSINDHLIRTVNKLEPVIKKSRWKGKTVVNLTSPEGYYQTPYPIEDYLFLLKIFQPLTELCRSLPEWLHFHLGTIAVEPTGVIPYQKFPQLVSVYLPISDGGGYETRDFNALYGYHRKKMMNVALFGEGGSGVVDFYTKGVVALRDPHVITHEQVIASNKSRMILSKLLNETFIKQLIICAEYTSDYQKKELKRFLRFNPKVKDIPCFGHTDVIGNGISIDPTASLYDTISITDNGNHIVSKLSHKQSFFMRQRVDITTVPHKESEVEEPCGESWPVKVKIKTFERVSIGNLFATTKDNWLADLNNDTFNNQNNGPIL